MIRVILLKEFHWAKVIGTVPSSTLYHNISRTSNKLQMHKRSFSVYLLRQAFLQALENGSQKSVKWTPKAKINLSDLEPLFI